MGILCLFLQGLPVPLAQDLGFLSHTDSINSNVKPLSSGSQGAFFCPEPWLSMRRCPAISLGWWMFSVTFSFRVKPFNRPDFTGKVRCQAQLPNGQTSLLSPQMVRLKPQAFHDSREASHTPHPTQLPELESHVGFSSLFCPLRSPLFSLCNFKLRRVV